VQEIHSAGDYVFARWVGRGRHVAEISGIAATGAPIAVEALTMARIAGGRIAEDWTVWDALGLLQQIGAVPAPV
jgi:predicted ester cyclase